MRLDLVSVPCRIRTGVAAVRAKIIKPVITLDDLGKIDIRVGTILSVEDVLESNKLVSYPFNFGGHESGLESVCSPQ